MWSAAGSGSVRLSFLLRRAVTATKYISGSPAPRPSVANLNNISGSFYPLRRWLASYQSSNHSKFATCYRHKTFISSLTDRPPGLTMLTSCIAPMASSLLSVSSWSDNNRFSREYSTAKPPLFPLSEFRDPVPRSQRAVEPVGRAWRAKELRRKSYDDLHKLWIVLYKERNMLLTEQQLSRRKGIPFPQPQRIVKVRKGMGAIKQVLGERKREHLSRLASKTDDSTDASESNAATSSQ